jgi:serine/threonine protein kinase
VQPHNPPQPGGRGTTISTTTTTNEANHGLASQGVTGLTSSPTQPFVLPFEPGEVIASKYRIQKLIGNGGVGFVVAATHVGLDDSVALKFLKPEFAGHQEAVTRFTIEARASFKIKNEHVARVLDVDTLPNGTPFMVMELLEGQDLRSILERHRFLPVDLAVDFALQTCEALAAAHACHIVHRDIKPENLFVTQSGEDDHIKVLDFGISKVALTQQPMPTRKTRASSLTMMAVGTPPYMSPEQVRASNSLDARADQWSLGCVLYELLTGSAPFERMSLMQACAAVLEDEPLPLREGCPGVPAELEQAVMRCLRKEPAQRYADIAEFARAIAPFGTRYAKCADRCSELLAEGQRRSDPGYRISDPPPLRRSDPLGIRIPTRPSIPPNIADSADRTRPSMRFVPPPAARLTGSSLAPIPAPVAPIPTPQLSAADLDSAPSPLTEADLLEAEELDPDFVPGLRPRKNRWILLAVGALTALSATYLAVRRLDSVESRNASVQITRSAGEAPSHVGAVTAMETGQPSALDGAPVTPAPESSQAVRATEEATRAAEAPGHVAQGAPAATDAATTSTTALQRKLAARKPVKVAPRTEDPDVGF